MKPFVKWAGGKRQILKRINEFISDSIVQDSSFTYIEPFLGGGAVFFDRRPSKAIINDLNEDLINAYKIIKSESYVNLIKVLEKHAISYKKNPDEYYYDIRSWDRSSGWRDNYTDVERAGRMIFLNKTCYNGLYRVNSKGQFNTPIGRYNNPTICDKKNIKEIHDYLSSKENNIEIMNGSYKYAIDKASDGDVIYIDPPYDYDDDDGFTKYQETGFTFTDFKKLKMACDYAINRGAFVIISNNATEKVINLFEQDPHYQIFYDINKFRTLRSINCKGTKRKTGEEAIFWGMPNSFPFPQANDMNKIIKLVMSDECVLKNKQEIQSIIDVTTNRQVAYYLSALQYLNFLTHDKKFTTTANEIRHSEDAVRKNIYNQLLKVDLFSVPYKKYKENMKIDIDKIKSMLSESSSKMAESTVNRRASTIKSWVEWMYLVDIEWHLD